MPLMDNTPPVSDRTPACVDTDPDAQADLRALFESTRSAEHALAAAICETCPVVNGCLQLAFDTSILARWAGAPEGTWGGVLWVAGMPKQRGKRVAA